MEWSGVDAAAQSALQLNFRACAQFHVSFFAAFFSRTLI